jgi:hypothetical protein
MAKKSVSQILTEIRAFPETLRITLSDSEADHELYQLYYILSETDKTVQNQAIDIVFKVPPLKDDAYINSPLPVYMATPNQFRADLITEIEAQASTLKIKAYRIIRIDEDKENADLEFDIVLTTEAATEEWIGYKETGSIILKKKKV